MQIVIDIDEEIYRKIEAMDWKNTLGRDKVWVAVHNGTPLPKGHGRLGDLDELEKEMVNGIKAGLLIEGYENYAHINDMDDCVKCVKYAPTIIEADKEGDAE